MEPNLPQHDETIVPVRPNLRGAAAQRSAAAVVRPRSWRLPLTALGGVALVVAAVAAFYWLPARVEEERVVVRPAADPVTAAEPARRVLSAEEREALRVQSGNLLAGLLTLQDDLTQLNVADWAAEDWAKYQELSEAGDNAFLVDDLRVALALHMASCHANQIPPHHIRNSRFVFSRTRGSLRST